MLKDLELIFLIIFTTLMFVCCILLKKNNYRYLSRKDTNTTLLVVFTQFTMFLCFKYFDLIVDFYYYFPFNYYYLYILYKILLKSKNAEENKFSTYFNYLWYLLVLTYCVIGGLNFSNFLFYYYLFYEFSVIFILIQCLLFFISIFKSTNEISKITNYYFQYFIVLSILHLTFFVFCVVNQYSINNLQIEFLTYLTVYIAITVLSMFFLIDDFSKNVEISSDFVAIPNDYSGKNKDIDPQKLNMKNEDSLSEKYKKCKISVSDLELIKIKIEKIETDQLYLNPELDLEMLSNQFKIPKYTLSQSFGSILGTNFKDYVNTLRCEFATKLLVQEDLNYNIIEIAYQSGFNSKTSFYRAFNKIYQCSPAEYKQRTFEK